MKQLIRQPSGSNQKHIFTHLQEELTQLQMDPKENALFLDVDLIAWTQKRLDKSSWK
ncbi:MAG: hypothetical protein N4A41_13970 [Crocinitomicaceae bacterium]|nr:hypothetical protein [Crocinitomicaceae bacterium]